MKRSNKYANQQQLIANARLKAAQRKVGVEVEVDGMKGRPVEERIAAMQAGAEEAAAAGSMELAAAAVLLPGMMGSPGMLLGAGLPPGGGVASQIDVLQAHQQLLLSQGAHGAIPPPIRRNGGVKCGTCQHCLNPAWKQKCVLAPNPKNNGEAYASSSPKPPKASAVSFKCGACSHCLNPSRKQKCLMAKHNLTPPLWLKQKSLPNNVAQTASAAGVFVAPGAPPGLVWDAATSSAVLAPTSSEDCRQCQDASLKEKHTCGKAKAHTLNPDGSAAPKKKRKKDPAAPKPAKSAWLFFSVERRPTIKEAHPEKNQSSYSLLPCMDI